MNAGVSPCVALCAFFPVRSGKDTESGFHGKNRADLTRHSDGSADSGAGSNLKQEKERWVAAAPSSRSQRTATPTVQGFSSSHCAISQGGLQNDLIRENVGRIALKCPSFKGFSGGHVQMRKEN